MKVVILPRDATPKEIEEVENRYQYHTDGKEEYTTLIRHFQSEEREASGMTLEEQPMMI
ncbi:MAG: hypothetical protein IPJ10_12590 [Flavobacteriales bacterium]|nr:hypothetical protein [Flavobacteriales bacterium]